ncbi:MAG TPA: MBL fold metallo-hydrolase [Candidatus Krumholzibacteriaceae bacterium]|nr:MBL fold metallo-hydrolase [Candidatus Krumholzibacteriaceae bacterium]
MKIGAAAAAVLLTVIVICGCERGVDIEQTGLVKLDEKTYAYIAEGPSFENGLGANAGFVVGGEGVLVVDSRYTPELAGELLRSIRTVTDLPVKYLVNTHYHPVNVWGNSVFRKEGAVIISRPETKRDIKRYSHMYKNYYKKKNPEKYKELQDIEIVPPDSMMGKRLSLDLGGTEVTLDYFGPAHTEGDCIVSVGEGKIIFTGGVLSKGYHPNLADPNADYDNWQAVLEKLKEMDPVYLVPGAGKVCLKEDIETESEYITSLRDMCREKIRKGVPVEEAVSSITAEGVIQGSGDYHQENILSFNIRSLLRKEAFSTINPDFKFVLPSDFRVGGGAGNRKIGRIYWMRRTGNKYEEIEVQWQPTAREQIIMPDIYDRAGNFECTAQQRELKIKGEKEILIKGSPVKAAYGAWFHKTKTVSLRGMWTLTAVIEKNKLYTILCAATAGGKQEIEKESIRDLEEIVSTFETISEERASRD